MYDCEICGKQTESLYVIDVEGAQLSVCVRCAKGKNVIDEIGESGEPERHKVASRKEEVEVIVEGYGEKIRKAREAMGIPLKTLGEMINEKKSTLLRVEEEKMQPNVQLAAKLEKALGIKLNMKAEEEEKGSTPKSGPITLGDAAFKKPGK